MKKKVEILNGNIEYWKIWKYEWGLEEILRYSAGPLPGVQIIPTMEIKYDIFKLDFIRLTICSS